MAFPGAYDKTDNGRQLTSKLWRDFNPAAMASDPGRGFFIMEDFLTLPDVLSYTLTQATTGTITLNNVVEAYGVALLDSGSTTTQQGANLQFHGQSITPAAGVEIAFETRLKVVDTGSNATTGEIFTGLASVSTTIISGSAVPGVTDWIGYYSVTDDGVLLGGADDGTASLFTTPGTATEDTYIKVGFRINGLTSLEFYFNGEEFSQTVALTSIPDTFVCPSFVMQSSGTTDPIMHIDWYGFAVSSP